MPVYQSPEQNAFLAGLSKTVGMTPEASMTGMATPLGIAGPVGGAAGRLGNWLSRIWGGGAPPRAITSGVRAADPLFTPDEQAAFGEVQRLYQNYFGKPVQLGVQESRVPEMQMARRYLGQYEGAVDPDTFEHIKNAFIAGMKHGGSIVNPH